jgi:molecular chaperone GrpE
MSPRLKKKKDLEKRVKTLEESLETEKKNSELYLRQLKYAKADLQNLQKQTEKRIEDTISRANGRLLLQLLPILDELNMAIEASKNGSSIVDGLEMVSEKLRKVMEAEGVTSIEAVGKAFDPRYHEAVLEIETKEQPTGTVVDEFRSGYMYRDRVLRASMVKVAKNPSSDENEEEVKDE